jgi:Ig-like domain CHU_C associated
MKYLSSFKNLLILCTMFICVLMNKTFGQESPSQIITGRLVRVSPKLTDIKIVPLDTKTTPSPTDEKAMEFRMKVNKKRQLIKDPKFIGFDKSIQNSIPLQMLNREPKVLTQSFNGAGATDNAAVGFGALVPPDPCVSVGPNHVVQMINLVHKVYNKSGTLLTGPLKFSAIATTATDDGDPITLYDHIADRWILLQFSKLFTNGQESLIFCVSQTGDPTGAYNVYEFITTGVFPDYPHVGIWNNAYVVTTHNFNTAGNAYVGQGFWAFDRNKMIAGTPTTTAIGFNLPSDFGYLPASTEGVRLPESSSMPTFLTYDINKLQYRTLTPNFVTPASSVLSAAVDLTTTSFDPRESTVEQSGTTATLDGLGDRMMSRVTYRRFDNYESMVLNHIVNVNTSAVGNLTAGTYQAAPRWYELTRANPTDPWTINQQSTFSPTAISGSTGINRWMSCPGIDQRGNIALAYSRSSSSNTPDIYYAERKKSDPLNSLGVEQIFHLSGGSQTDASGRWGDYSAMTTDPVDEETMWFTAEYYAATSARGFSTRIGSFKISDPITTQTVHFQKSGTIARQIESTTPSSGPPNFPYKDYPITVMIDNAPSQNANLTLIKTGTATEGTDYDILNASALVLNGTTLSQNMTLRVYDDGLVNEANEFVDLSYTLNANGGNATAGTFNQKHRITIIGVSACPTSVNVTTTRPTTFCEGDSVILNGNTNPNYTYQWFRNGTLISGATQAQYIAKASGNYHVEFTRTGCTLPSTPITVIAKVGTPVPATVNRSIVFGTTITAGNGLQASAVCPGTSTQTYAGATVGYDNNTISGVNPTVTFSGVGTSLGKVSISVTWRKKSGGDQTSCGVTGGTGNPFNQEVSFKIKGPNNVTLNLLNSATYVSGGTPAGVVTTVFEDGGSAIGTVPASGTFNPAQSLAGFAGIDPNGVWTIIPNDNGLGDPLCVQGFAVTVTTPGTGAASSITWHDAATAGTQVGTGTEFIPTNTAVGTYTYYAQANCTGLADCANSIRKATTLTITPAPCNTIAGAVTADAMVCSGTNSGTLTLAGHTGTILRWESSTDNFATSTVISNTTTTQNYNNLTQTTKYRAVVKDGTCTESNSTPATITVSNTTVAGAVTADATVCTGSNSGTLTLAGYTGGILRWESSIDNFVTIVTIANTTTTQNYLNLAQTTKYRAVVQNGTCTAGNSSPATITVSNGTVAGAVTADATVCTGSNSGTLTLEGYTGSILRWESSIDNFVTIVTIANTTTTQNYTNLTQTTKYRAVVQNGICTSANSTPATITISNETVAGAVTTDATVCTGSNSGTLTLAGHTGSILRWESSIDNFVTPINIANITTTQNYANLTQTTIYRAVVQNGTCTSANSSPATITVLAPATPVASGATMTLGDPALTLTATGCTGSGFVLKWHQTSDNVGVTMPVAPPITTQYYAKCEQTVGVTVCLSPKSNDVTLTVNIPSSSVIVYVNIANIAAPIQNGNTWATAYGNLQTALASAPTGSEIWVAQGTYKPTNTTLRTISFDVPSGVKMYGGFIGTEVALNQRNFKANETLLSGDIGIVGTYTDDSYHVLKIIGANNQTVIDGFSIKYGYAANQPPVSNYSNLVESAFIQAVSNESGGGIFIKGSNPVINNCIIQSNFAIFGAGIFCEDGSLATTNTCVISGNFATFGGGVYNLNSNANYNNDLITGNKGLGGGMYNNHCNPTLTNLTVASNDGYVGGIYSTPNSGNESYPIIKNSILWNNTNIQTVTTLATITNSIVQGGYTGIGNRNLDPKFVNQSPAGNSPTTSGDYQLNNISPAIDAGDNGAISLTDKDLFGNLRRYNAGIVDMGAYEFQGNRVGGTVISITSGNWENDSTWMGGVSPMAGDNVIINNNHNVTILNLGIAKNVEIRTNAKIIHSTTSSKLQTGI